MNRRTPISAVSPWPHRVAVVLCCATFPLIWVGGLVTTYRAGMAVPDWPTTFGHNLFSFPLSAWLAGSWDLFIEHGHRLLGAAVGMLTMALVVVTWCCDKRRSLRAASVVALAMVVTQGVLGGARVIQDEVLLAMIHGCFGPAFFAYCTALALFTSPAWRARARISAHPAAAKLHVLSIMTFALAWFQLLLGAQIRHLRFDTTPEYFRAMVVFHVTLALVLTLHVAWLAAVVLARHRAERAVALSAALLLALVSLQVVLGAATWVTKYAVPAWAQWWPAAAQYVVEAEAMVPSLTATAHVATGSLILATSLVLALLAVRRVRPVDDAGALSAMVEAAA